MDAIKTLKTALTHATFQDPDIKTATDKLITKLGDELNAVGYDTGSEVEEAIGDVETAITAFEEQQEGGSSSPNAEEEDDDPFAGLEDPDEEVKA